jgi:hypothetical protein
MFKKIRVNKNLLRCLKLASLPVDYKIIIYFVYNVQKVGIEMICDQNKKTAKHFLAAIKYDDRSIQMNTFD